MPQAITITTANLAHYLESFGLLPAARQVTVMVFSGQSNVLSAGAINQFQGTGNVLDLLQPSVLRQFQYCYIWNPTAGAFQLMQAGVNNLDYNGSIGPEIGFAQRWEQLYPGVPLYIIKQSIPGVPISTWDDGQQGWADLNGYIANAKNVLKAAGLAPIMRGFWWNQGESNGGDAAYDGKLQNLTNRLYNREYLTVDTQFIIGLMRYDSVMRTQQTAYATRNQAYTKLVETVNYNMNSDNLHFTARAQFLSGYTDIPNALFGLAAPYPFPMQP